MTGASLARVGSWRLVSGNSEDGLGATDKSVYTHTKTSRSRTPSKRNTLLSRPLSQPFTLLKRGCLSLLEELAMVDNHAISRTCGSIECRHSPPEPCLLAHGSSRSQLCLHGACRMRNWDKLDKVQCIPALGAGTALEPALCAQQHIQYAAISLH